MFKKGKTFETETFKLQNAPQQKSLDKLTKAVVVLCFVAISCSTGFSSTTGSTDLSPKGLSGDPRGEYAVTTIPVTD